LLKTKLATAPVSEAPRATAGPFSFRPWALSVHDSLIAALDFASGGAAIVGHAEDWLGRLVISASWPADYPICGLRVKVADRTDLPFAGLVEHSEVAEQLVVDS
jgi:hypothetical protein